MRLCQELIWTGKLTSTYCMREHGHKGKCDPMYFGKLSAENEKLKAPKVEVEEAKIAEPDK